MTETSDILRQFLVWAVICIMLMLGSYFLPMQRVLWPVEQSLISIHQRMQGLVGLAGKPVEYIRFSQDGLQRIADLEQRLHDTVVDKARLVELEQEVSTLREMKQIEVGGWNVSDMVELIESQETVVINGGSRSGFEEGMVVVDEKGVLLGRLGRVHEYSAEVMVPEAVENRIAVVLLDSDIRAVLVGDGTRAELNELLQDAQVQVGDVVVTNGEDGVYPAGLVVAQVTQISGISSDVTKKAAVDLMGDTTHRVFVLRRL